MDYRFRRNISLDKTVKRRLVGALVIILLAIILVPAWLDGSARRLRDEDAFVVPLPPPDNRKAMVDPETIGEQITTEIPKLEPLPEPELVPATDKVVETTSEVVEAVEEKAEEVVAKVAEASANVAEPAAVVAEVMPDPVVVDLNDSTASGSRSAAAASSEIKVEVAESAAQRANWIVQVGSFASKQNAQAMVNRLKKGNLKAFMRDFKSNGDSIYRVLVGPFVRQTEADEAKRTIDRRFQVKSFVANWRG